MSPSLSTGSTALIPGVTFTLAQHAGRLECHIAGCTPQAGAVVHARWAAGRVVLEPAAGSSAEQQLARDCARRLCKAARQPVTCSVHLEVVHAGSEALAQSAAERIAEACRILQLARLRAAVAAPSGVFAALGGPQTDALELRVRSVLRAPLQELADRLRPSRPGPAVRPDEVLIFAPLYLSNACLNDCSYCGFRKSRRFARVTLNVPAAVAEARCLAGHGHRTLDLVSGEIPTDAFIGYVSDACSAILRDSPIERIHLNLGALSRSQYEQLLDAGATGYHLYQETYTPQAFFDAHGAGPKRDMANRLDAARRALDAGFRGLGLGVLLGLGPLERDLALLARHAQLLLEEFPGTQLGFSLPRIQEAGQQPGFVAHATIDDETFKRAVLFLALEFPAAHLTLTTRESASMRDTLLPLGITKLSAGVSTAPGGYQQGDRQSGEQFSIHDERSLGEVARQVRVAGRVPVYR